MILDPEAYEGAYRLSLIFAPAPSDDAYACQERLLEGSEAGFAERDLVRGNLFESGMGTFDGGAGRSEGVPAAREQFGVGTGVFAAVLVGKDGTIKRRFFEPVEPEELYAAIDAMPMRREMREKGRVGRGAS